MTLNRTLGLLVVFLLVVFWLVAFSISPLYYWPFAAKLAATNPLLVQSIGFATLLGAVFFAIMIAYRRVMSAPD